MKYPRNLVGYGRNTPDPRWPGGANIAVQFVVNYEEGGECCILDGDPASECLLSEIVGAQPWRGQRNLNMESIYEYGARSGFWRLWRAFTRRNMPVTVYGVTLAMARNPEAVAAMKEAGWEIASHGLRWWEYKDVPEEIEREHIREAVRLHTEVTGSRPLGIYQGKPSDNTLKLVMEEGGFLYSADSYADELPYWVKGPKGPHLIVPYTLDANDMRFATPQGFNSGDQFFTYLKDSFDVLYREGEEGAPKMMSIGLHCRLAGAPAAWRRWNVSSITCRATTRSGWPNVWISPATGINTTSRSWPMWCLPKRTGRPLSRVMAAFSSIRPGLPSAPMMPGSLWKKTVLRALPPR